MNRKPLSYPVIELDNLSKQYSKNNKFALDNLNLAIYPGEVYGFLGPNGAGKSTTLRLLMNFIQPTSGQAKIMGFDVVKDSLKIRRSIGYLAGDMAMYSKMTGAQYINYLCDIQSFHQPKDIKILAKRLGAKLDQKISELSRGNRQKIAIIQAFVHQPEILILDEPTSGLDPLVQEVFYELVNEAKNRGAAIFMSSHVLSEVQKICDRVAIIREGKLVSEKNIAEMIHEAAQTFSITFADKIPLSELGKVKGARLQGHDKNIVTLHMHGELSGLFAVLAKHKVTNIDARNLDLEETFMHYYQDTGTKK
jgi:ABC-2 type transport system ATP-binding protein